MVTPIGVGVQENWANILGGKSGIVSLKGVPELQGLKSQIGGRLPQHFNIEEHKTSVGSKRCQFYIVFRGKNIQSCECNHQRGYS
jgi:3-oxoacyl-(acyl-carrier-protein) synthase